MEKLLTTWAEVMPQPNDWIAEKNEEMQNSNSKEYGELIALRDARRKGYLNSANKNLDELLKKRLNHEEPPWRTPVTKGWWYRMKDDRIRWALRWFGRRFPTKWLRKLNSGKRKRCKHLELEFIPHEQTPKERINQFEEMRIRFIVCLSFIKLNWWQAMDFCILLILLEKDWEVTYRKLEKVFMNHREDWKNEWIEMIIKEKKTLEWTTVKFKMTDEREWITGKN